MHSTDKMLQVDTFLYISCNFEFSFKLTGDVKPIRVNSMWPSCGRFHYCKILGVSDTQYYTHHTAHMVFTKLD